jgi:quercetin dioxygenase-like cupin family protein
MSNTINNPVTGERIKFLEHPGEIDLLPMEFTIAPQGFVAAPHVHDQQEERFRIEAGTIRLRIGAQEVTAQAGESVSVPPGTPHVWWNPSDHDARVVVELRPSLRMESFLRQWFGLARDGKVDAHGMPKNPLQLAVVMREYRREIRPQHVVQDVLLVPLAVIGRLLGYRGQNSRYEGPGQDAPVIPSRG